MTHFVPAAIIAFAATLPSPIAGARAAPVMLTVPGGRLHLTQQGVHTVLAGKVRGRSVRVTLPADDGMSPKSLRSARLLGGWPDHVIILSTDYASRPGSPYAECGAGVETVLRIIALEPRIHQSFHKLVASCWRSIEADTIDWDPRAHRLTTTLSTPDGNISVQYEVTPAGAVTTVKEQPATAGGQSPS